MIEKLLAQAEKFWHLSNLHSDAKTKLEEDEFVAQNSEYKSLWELEVYLNHEGDYLTSVYYFMKEFMTSEQDEQVRTFLNINH